MRSRLAAASQMMGASSWAQAVSSGLASLPGSTCAKAEDSYPFLAVGSDTGRRQPSILHRRLVGGSQSHQPGVPSPAPLREPPAEAYEGRKNRWRHSPARQEQTQQEVVDVLEEAIVQGDEGRLVSPGCLGGQGLVAFRELLTHQAF